MKNFTIVSVESRKGGVGKTTAALNLAHLFLKKQYAVLFLDVDITGTNAADCLNSPFWDGIATPINYDGEKANLLQVFQTKFMSGQRIPSFSFSKKKDSLQVNVERINVFGSQIYDFVGFENDKVFKPGRKSRIICKPSILFDELHAFWFIEFLQEICAAFSSMIGDMKVAVIIDNSPGYVGIAPAVQDWLTDLGPVSGKFLTISSLDTQDFTSCAHAVDELHQLFLGKCNAGHKFIESCGSNTKTEIQIGDVDMTFFERLAELSRFKTFALDTHITGADLAFYRNRKNNPVLAADKYQALIINRVPQDIKRGFYEYENSEVDSPDGTVKSLLGKDKHDIMVGYDSYIEYQFIYSKLSRIREKLSKRQGHIKVALDEAISRRPILEDGCVNRLLFEHEQIKPESINNIRKYIRDINANVSGIRHILEENGFAHLSKLINEDWLPSSILPTLQNNFRYAFLGWDLHYHDSEFDNSSKFENMEILTMLENLQKRVKRISLERGLPEKIVERLFPSFATVVGLALNRALFPPYGEELMELLSAVFIIEVTHLHCKRKTYEVVSIQRFLANDTLKQGDFHDYETKLQFRSHWLEEVYIARIYKACVCAQSRFLDLREDAQFLVDIMCRMVEQELQKPTVMPYVRGIAEKVIIAKTMTHETGRKQIIQGFVRAKYMEDFSAVLERTLKQWQIPV